MTSAPLPPAEAALIRAGWQETLFAERLRRSALLRLQPLWPVQTLRVQVHRNQPFELIATAMRPFLAYAGLEAAFTFSDYDDALTLSDIEDADVHVLSLDFARYSEAFSPSALITWISERVTFLRSRTTAPIMLTDSDKNIEGFNDALREQLQIHPSTYVCSVGDIAQTCGTDFWDERSADIKATAWSDQAVLQMARAFGLQWLPAVVLPPVKALAVDLDNTLYEGVLGEDGTAGIHLTSDYIELQQHLTFLSNNGVFIALISRNEQEDVEALFANRPEFALRRKEVAAVVANWQPKSDNIVNVADLLHIHTDAIIFVDDNAGELAAVAAALPTIKTIHATEPRNTLRAMMYYPGMFRFAESQEGRLRVADIIAAQEREAALVNAPDSGDYLASLDIRLHFYLNDRSRIARMHELTTKTNQFNVSLARTNEATITRGLDSGDMQAVTVSLRDRLSDSGVIGLVLGSSDGSTVIIEELTISCRALGRELEDALIFHAIALLNGQKPPEIVVFRWTQGPRNAPALDWLRRWVPDLSNDGSATLKWDADTMRHAVAATPATLNTERME